MEAQRSSGAHGAGTMAAARGRPLLLFRPLWRALRVATAWRAPRLSLPTAARLTARWVARVCAAVSAAVLAACGGGLSIGIGGSFGFDDTPPRINLAAAQESATAGTSLRLVAAAADENGIDRVVFYRLDGAAEVLLGSDGGYPYEWTLVVPADGRSRVDVFARAYDNEGNRADSAIVTIAVVP